MTFTGILALKTARGCRAPHPVLDSQTCSFQISLCPAISPPAKCWSLREGDNPWTRARAGFGFGAAGLALEERRPLLPRPHELKFRAHCELGVLESGNSGLPEGTEVRRWRAPYFQWVWAAEGRGRPVSGPREKRGAPTEGAGAIFSGILRAEVGTEAAAQGAHGGCTCGAGAAVGDCAPRSPLNLPAETRRSRAQAQGARPPSPPPHRHRRPGAWAESGARRHAPARRWKPSVLPAGGSLWSPAGRGSSLLEQGEAPGLVDPGRRAAPASYPSRAAAAAAAPATACPDLAAMPALGGEGWHSHHYRFIHTLQTLELSNENVLKLTAAVVT
ncbi:uncharacterized protein LOC130679673 [Manis pentadactyla]|uniref:uncharacterized protein LOC130679673 n=1 Tax=Manis pentadactyla TaxID=143292 RepID=UPI00255C88E9|nr:uncharacterized protein LOC130679673 [Manis pentadactyla]